MRLLSLFYKEYAYSLIEYFSGYRYGKKKTLTKFKKVTYQPEFFVMEKLIDNLT